MDFASAGKIGKRRVDVWRATMAGNVSIEMGLSLFLLSTNCISADNELAIIASSEFCVASSDNP
jgi:hypothetical protein